MEAGSSSCQENSVPKKFRGIDSERFSLFRGKSAHFTEFRESQNSPFRGSERTRNGIKFREKIRFDGTAKITTKKRRCQVALATAK
jgi:hypothetical protein